MTKAAHALKTRQRLGEGLPQRNPTIFSRVVHVDMQIAGRRQIQVKGRMSAERVQHMVQKSDPRGDRGLAGPVHVQRRANAGLFGDPLDTGLARHGLSQFHNWLKKRHFYAEI